MGLEAVLQKGKGKILKVSYFFGSFDLVNGIAKSKKSSSCGNYSFINRGTGWGELRIKSELIAYIETSEKKIKEVHLEKMVRGSLNTKLTKRVRDAIKKSAPEELEIEEVMTYSGGTYLRVSNKDAKAWINNAKKYL